MVDDYAGIIDKISCCMLFVDGASALLNDWCTV